MCSQLRNARALHDYYKDRSICRNFSTDAKTRSSLAEGVLRTQKVEELKLMGWNPRAVFQSIARTSISKRNSRQRHLKGFYLLEEKVLKNDKVFENGVASKVFDRFIYCLKIVYCLIKVCPCRFQMNLKIVLLIYRTLENEFLYFERLHHPVQIKIVNLENIFNNFLIITELKI